MHEQCFEKYECPLKTYILQEITKSKLITSKQVPLLPFCKDTHNLSEFVLNILNFLKLYCCCILHNYLNIIYFPEIYISILTALILVLLKLVHATSISTIAPWHNQSIIFLLVFSKYVLSRIRNIFPIQKKQAMIQISV